MRGRLLEFGYFYLHVNAMRFKMLYSTAFYSEFPILESEYGCDVNDWYCASRIFLFTLITVRKKNTGIKRNSPILNWYEIHILSLQQNAEGKMKKNFIDRKIPFHFSWILCENM